VETHVIGASNRASSQLVKNFSSWVKKIAACGSGSHSYQATSVAGIVQEALAASQSERSHSRIILVTPA
jgi:hypothetical protein